MEINDSEANKLFEKIATELGLINKDRALAFVFWSGFQKAVVAKNNAHPNPDQVRDYILEEGFNKLNVSFQMINVNSDKGFIPFYTISFNNSQLVFPGNDSFIYRPKVDTQKLSKINKESTYEVRIGLSRLSQSIISGAANIHRNIRPDMRPDLQKSSVTMKDHFIQAILSVADKGM